MVLVVLLSTLLQSNITQTLQITSKPTLDSQAVSSHRPESPSANCTLGIALAGRPAGGGGGGVLSRSLIFILHCG